MFRMNITLITKIILNLLNILKKINLQTKIILAVKSLSSKNLCLLKGHSHMLLRGGLPNPLKMLHDL